MKAGVGFVVRVADLRSQGRILFPTEITPGGVDSACHSAEVGEMSTSVLRLDDWQVR